MGVKLEIEATLNQPLGLASLDVSSALTRVVLEGAQGSQQRPILVQGFFAPSSAVESTCWPNSIVDSYFKSEGFLRQRGKSFCDCPHSIDRR